MKTVEQMEQPNRRVASASLAAAGLSAVNDLAYSGRLRYGAAASRLPQFLKFCDTRVYPDIA